MKFLQLVLMVSFGQVALSLLYGYSKFARTGEEDCLTDVIFLLDESGSITSTQYNQIIQFIDDVVTELGSLAYNDIRYGAVTFGWGADVAISLQMGYRETDFKANLATAVLPQGTGGTDTKAGILTATDEFIAYSTNGANRLMIILTDGLPDNEPAAEAAATAAKDNENIRISAVCVQCDVNVVQLEEMVSDPTDSNIIDIDTPDDLDDYVDALADTICPPRGRRICECDMVFVMDGSGSINDAEGILLENFVKDVVLLLGDLGGNSVHFGAVVFATSAKLTISLEDELTAVPFEAAVALDRAGLGSATKIHKGINMAQENLERYGRNDSCSLIVVLTDGDACCSSGDDTLAINAANDAKNDGTEIFSVCVSTDCDDFVLQELASDDVDDHYLQADQVSELQNYVQDLVDILCPDPCFETPADIFFMIDESGSTIGYFEAMKDFLAEIASRVATSTESVRIGVILFNTQVTSVIPLTAYQGVLLHDLYDAIQAIVHSGGGTYLWVPIEEMINQFNLSGQERHGARRIGVMVSDFLGYTPQLDDTVKQAKLYEGIELFSVTVGNLNPLPLGLQLITSDPKADHMYQVSVHEDLLDLVDLFVRIFCIPSYCTHVPVDVVFVIDKSGSVEDDFMPIVKDFLRDIYALLGIYTQDFRMGVILYSGTPAVVISLNDQNDIMGGIDTLPDTTSGGTNTALALELMIDEFAQYGNPVARWVSVVMTDGYSGSVIQATQDANALSIFQVAIAIGDSVSASGLLDLVQQPSHIIPIKTYIAVPAVMYVLVKFFCNPCEPVHVYFLLDESCSISEPEFFIELQFAADLANRLLEYPDNEAGAIFFAFNAYHAVSLTADAYSFTHQLALKSFNPSSSSNVKAGIDIAANELTNSSVQRFIVILSDGDFNYMGDAEASAVAARSQGIRIAGVGVTSHVVWSKFKALVSHPHCKYLFHGYPFSSLMKIEKRLLKLLCDSPCKERLAILFIIDKSYSIPDSDVLEAIELAHATADILFDNSVDIQAGSLLFDGKTSVSASTLTGSVSTFHEELNALSTDTGEDTNLTVAYSTAFNIGLRRGWQNGYYPVLVFLSDGSPTDYHKATFVFNWLNPYPHRIYSVGVGIDVNEYLLDNIARKHENTLYSHGEYLPLYAKKLAKMICPAGRPEARSICGETEIILRFSMCCDGIVQKRPGGPAACCGQESYNLDTHVCCGGHLSERTTEQNVCPSTHCYNTSKHICCNGKFTEIVGEQTLSCCGDLSYDTEHYACCNGYISERKEDGECCGSVHFNPRELVCCNGHLNGIIPFNSNPECCGYTLYYPVIGHKRFCCSHCYPPKVYEC